MRFRARMFYNARGMELPQGPQEKTPRAPALGGCGGHALESFRSVGHREAAGGTVFKRVLPQSYFSWAISFGSYQACLTVTELVTDIRMLRQGYPRSPGPALMAASTELVGCGLLGLFIEIWRKFRLLIRR